MLERLERPLPVGWEEQRHLFLVGDLRRRKWPRRPEPKARGSGPRAIEFRCNQRKRLDWWPRRAEPIRGRWRPRALFPCGARPTDRPQALVDAMRALLRFFTSVRLIAIVLALLAVVLAALHWLAELFWFQALGYAEVFWRLLLCQLGLFAATTCLVFIYAWGNLRVLARHVDLLQSGLLLEAARDGAPIRPRIRVRARLISDVRGTGPARRSYYRRVRLRGRMGRPHPLSLGTAIRRDGPALRPRHRLLPVQAPVPGADPEHDRGPGLHGHRAARHRLRPGRARRLPSGCRDRRSAIGAPPSSRQRRAVPVRLGVGIRPRSLRAVDRVHRRRVRGRLHRRSRHELGAVGCRSAHLRLRGPRLCRDRCRPGAATGRAGRRLCRPPCS